MSHIHIPDGVLPLWLILAGWAAAVVLVALATWSLRGDTAKRVPLLGVMAALMLVGMSTEVVPIAYHTNLSVLAGIVLGPAYGILAALIVNLFLALFGHGGITVVGLNTLVVGTEAALGYFAFRMVRRAIRSPSVAAGLATVFTLFLTTWLLVGIVWSSGVDAASAREVGPVDPSTLTFGNPFAEGVLANRLVSPEAPARSEATGIGFVNILIIWFGLGFVGWILEALVTGAIVGFIARVRPDLVLGHRRPAIRVAR